MAILVLEEKISPEQLVLVQEEYPGYVKVVVDIGREILGAGGEWHADAEKVLLDLGSRQADLWGGGLDLENQIIEFTSLINMRPGISRSQEVLDQDVRLKMEAIIKAIFGL